MKTKLLVLLIITANILQAQWIHQNSGVNVGLSDVYCITEDIVIVVGGIGTILKTTDGGENWIQKTSNTTEHLNKVKFANSTTGYTIGENGTLLKTIDTGENWTIIDTSETVELYGLSCVNEDIVYITGKNGLIKKTEDGGVTWVVQDCGLTIPIYHIQFVSENIGYATAGGYSDTNYFLKTIDSGITWVTESLGGGATIALCFFDENIGFKGSVEIDKTIDGGSTWENVWGNNSLSFSIDAISPDMVWTAGFNIFAYDGYIYKGNLTLPHDDVWNYIFVDLEYYMAIDFANETTGYVVGFNDNDGTGLIKKNSTGINTLSNNGQILQDALIIQPNPVNDVINISFNKNGPIDIVIINTTGNRIIQKYFIYKDSLTLDVSFLSAGIYFLKIQSEGQILTKKIIKL